MDFFNENLPIPWQRGGVQKGMRREGGKNDSFSTGAAVAAGLPWSAPGGPAGPREATGGERENYTTGAGVYTVES